MLNLKPEKQPASNQFAPQPDKPAAATDGDRDTGSSKSGSDKPTLTTHGTLDEEGGGGGGGGGEGGRSGDRRFTVSEDDESRFAVLREPLLEL